MKNIKYLILLISLLFTTMLSAQFVSEFNNLVSLSAPTVGDYSIDGIFTNVENLGPPYTASSILTDSTHYFIDAEGTVFVIVAVPNLSPLKLEISNTNGETINPVNGLGQLTSINYSNNQYYTSSGVSKSLLTKIQRLNVNSLRFSIERLADTSNIVNNYKGLMVYVENTDEYWYNKPPWTLWQGGTGTDSFDFDRPMLRVPVVGINVGVSTITDFFEWHFFSAPELSLILAPSTTVYEIGTVNAIDIVTNIDNPASAVLSAGVLLKTAPGTVDTITNIGTTAGNITGITYQPQQDSIANFKGATHSFQSRQTYDGAGETGTISSNTRTITAVYPVLYGVSATDFTVAGTPYTGLTKLVQAEGNKAVNMNGSGFIYFLFPDTWTDTNLSSIIDANGFNVTPSFTKSTVNVTSSGLVNNWTQGYIIYKLNTSTTISNGTYTFNR